MPGAHTFAKMHAHIRTLAYTHSGSDAKDYCTYQIASGTYPKVGTICLAKPQDAHPTQVHCACVNRLPQPVHAVHAQGHPQRAGSDGGVEESRWVKNPDHSCARI